jgi:hypothetical protein
MNEQELKKKILALDDEGMIRFICHLLYELTLESREIYPNLEPGDMERLEQFNGINHVAITQLEKIYTGNNKRYSDEAFCNGLLERCRRGRCGGSLMRATEYAFACQHPSMGDEG